MVFLFSILKSQDCSYVVLHLQKQRVWLACPNYVHTVDVYCRRSHLQRGGAGTSGMWFILSQYKTRATWIAQMEMTTMCMFKVKSPQPTLQFEAEAMFWTHDTPTFSTKADFFFFFDRMSRYEEWKVKVWSVLPCLWLHVPWFMGFFP